jgi:cytochrome P450
LPPVVDLNQRRPGTPDIADEAELFLAAGHPDRGEIVADPYPFFDRLRSANPVFRTRSGPWLLSSADACDQMLKSPAFVRAVANGPEERPCYRVFLGSLVFLDAPDHIRLRRLVTPAFRPSTINARRTATRRTADDLLAPLVAADSFDFRAEYAYRLPVNVICQLLGIPVEETADWALWPYYVRTLQELRDFTEAELDEADAVATRCIEFFSALIAERRTSPSDDLISQVLEQQARDGALITDDELSALLMLLHLGGHSTTAEVMTTAMFQLLMRPELYDELIADPDLVVEFIDEVMRFDAPVVTALIRTATEDTEVGGQVIPAGDRAFALITAANRDPEAFPDPHRFDLHRDDRKHLAFGGGAHYCVGAHLAKQEAEEAFRSVLAGPRLRLAVDPSDLRWTDHLLHRGITALPVEVAR